MDLLFSDNGRLRAGWRFCLGALVFAGSEMVGRGAGAAFWRLGVLPAEFIAQAISLTILLGGFAFLLIAVDHVEDDALASMGLGFRRGTVRQIVIGLTIGCAMVMLCFAALLIWADDVDIRGHIGSFTMLRAAVALSVLAAGAMAEEAAFRGYPFQRLVDMAGPAAAIVVMQICFGLVHRENPNLSRWGLVNTVLFGVLLAVAYLRSRSLWLPWGIHFGWNATLAVGLGLPMSGLNIFASVLRTHVRGPDWLTGGKYGIEGGALTTVAVALAFPAAWWAAKTIGRSGSREIGQSEETATKGLPDSPITRFPDHPSADGSI